MTKAKETSIEEARQIVADAEKARIEEVLGKLHEFCALHKIKLVPSVAVQAGNLVAARIEVMSL